MLQRKPFPGRLPFHPPGPNNAGSPAAATHQSTVGSGKFLLSKSADHYLTIEDAVTVGELLLSKLKEIFENINPNR